MKDAPLPEILVSLVLIVLLLALLNPFGVLMFTMFHMMLLVLVLIVFGLFLVFLWKESPADEREVVHQSQAGRVAFLVGSILLLAGIVYQTFSGGVMDHWLIAAFSGMVLAKVVALAYVRLEK